MEDSLDYLKEKKALSFMTFKKLNIKSERKQTDVGYHQYKGTRTITVFYMWELYAVSKYYIVNEDTKATVLIPSSQRSFELNRLLEIKDIMENFDEYWNNLNQ